MPYVSGESEIYTYGHGKDLSFKPDKFGGKFPQNFDDIRDAVIDGEGECFYLTIQITDTVTDRTRHVVRSFKEAERTFEILQVFMHEELCEINNSVKRTWEVYGFGGGKINHDLEAKKMHVHGYSYTFGTCDHRETIDIL